jgi:hypothetical protein
MEYTLGDLITVVERRFREELARRAHNGFVLSIGYREALTVKVIENMCPDRVFLADSIIELIDAYYDNEF